jgi:multidrug efflux pump subunit AcrB
LDGASEVALPILVSTVTFCVVFYPIVLLSGLAKFLFTPLAIAATIAIVASYIIAMTLVPAYCAKFLRIRPRGDGAAQGENAFTQGFGRLLATVVTLRYAIVAGAAALCVGAFLLLTTMGSELFPPVDAGQFTIYVRMPSGTRIELTEETITDVEQVVMDTLGQADPAFGDGNEQDPDSYLQMVISNIGVLMDWPAAYTPNTGPMDSFVLVQLKDKAGRPGVFEAVSELRKKLNEQFPSVEFAFDTGGMMTAALNLGEPSPIHFQITGSNLHTAQDIGCVVKEEAAQVAGAVDVRIAQRMDYPTLEVKMDRISAAYQGVSVDDVMKNLVSATNSSINFDPAFWIAPNGNHYFLGVQYAEEDINSLDTLRDVPITGENSTRPVSLRNVAEIEQGTGPAVINHRNITRATDIYANVLPGYDVGTIVERIEARLEQNPKLGLETRQTERGKEYDVGGEFAGQGYSLQMQGEVRSMRESFEQFSSGLMMAVVLVYLVMVAQFRSFIDPFVILLTVPLGFVGVVGMLWITGGTLSIMSFMGLIMMVGIVVEYSIVLIDFANHRVHDGLNPRDAIIEATKVRLRPILMTSLTTWLALLPMAAPQLFLEPFGLSGGDANVPLARAIIGGVLGATVLSLLVVPCLYVMMKRPPSSLPNSAQASTGA